MKRRVGIGILCALILISVCASGERSHAVFHSPTVHARSIQAYIAEAPCWDEEWLRVELNHEGYLPVYAAPFEQLDEEDPGPYRGANGRAQVGTAEPFSVLASRRNGEWLLIQYEIGKGKNRIGWIQLPQELMFCAEDIEEAQFTEAYAAARRDTHITDDPYGSQRVLRRINCDEELKCLGWVDAYYAYVQTIIDGQAAYGFVPLEDLAEPKGRRIEEVEALLVGAWQFIGGAELMGYGIVFDENGRYMMCDTDDLTVFPPQNLRLSIGSAGRYEVVPNDHPTQEFWHEDAGYALVLRDDEGGVQRYEFDGISEENRDRISLYYGEGGGNYGRMKGKEAQKLLGDMAHTKVYVLKDYSRERVSGKMGVTRDRELRVDMQLLNPPAARRILLYDGPAEENGKCFGEALPAEGEWGRYLWEGELPKDTWSIYFAPEWEDGTCSGEMFSVGW